MEAAQQPKAGSGAVAKPRRKASSKPKVSTDTKQTDQESEDAAAAAGEALGIEVTPAALLEVKRRKAAFSVMMRLLEEGAPDQETLVRMCAPMSGEELVQVAEERSLAGRCGSPLCANSIPTKLAQHDRWHAVGEAMDRERGPVYCSAMCGQLVRNYAAVLGDPMKRLRPEAREKLLVSHKPKAGARHAIEPEVAAQVNGVTTMLAEIQERSSKPAPPPTQPIPANSQVQDHSAHAVEGYVPREVQRRQKQQQLQQQQQAQVQASVTVSSEAFTSTSHQSTLDTVTTSAPSESGIQQSEAVVASRMAASVARHIHLLIDDVSVPTSAPIPFPATSTGDSGAATAGLDPQQSATSHDGSDDRHGKVQGAAQGDAGPTQHVVDDDELNRWAQALQEAEDAREAQARKERGEVEGEGGEDEYGFGMSRSEETGCSHLPTAHTQRWIPSSTPARTILKKGPNAGDKKHVRWADENAQEFLAREGSLPETPVLVFTLEGKGGDMEGAMDVVDASRIPGDDKEEGKADQGNEGANVKKIAGRLKVEDAARLHSVTEAALQLAATAPAHPPDPPQAFSQQQQVPKIPKSLRLLFPPAAGGYGVALRPAGSPADSKRKFRPKVPSTRSTTVTATSSSTTSATPASSDAAANMSRATGLKQGQSTSSIHQNAARLPSTSSAAPSAASWASSSVTAADFSGRQTPGFGPGTAPKSRVLGRSNVSKIVMLDAPPDKPLAPNPVTARLRTTQPQQSSPQDAPQQQQQLGTQQPSNTPVKLSNPRVAVVRRAPSPAPAPVLPQLPHISPSPEVLPFEDVDTQPFASGVCKPSNDTRGKMITIRTDARHSAPWSSSQVCPPGNGRNNGSEVQQDQDENSDSDQSEQQGFWPEQPSGRAGHERGVTGAVSTERQVGGDEDDGDDGYSIASAEESSDVESELSDEDGESEGSEEGQSRRAGVSRRRAVRADVIYEEDDEEQMPGEELVPREGQDDGSEVDEAYEAAMPFFGPPPGGYRLELSPYNMLWSLLSSWVTRETLQYMQAPSLIAREWSANAAAAHDTHADSADEDGDSSAAKAILVALPSPSMASAQARVALAELLFPHLSAVLNGLKARVPLGEVTKRASGFLRTLAFPGPIPALSGAQWRLLALSVLRALSLARLPGLADAFERREGGALLEEVLRDTGFELPHLSALIDLLVND